jgi:hypothetical protein
MKISITTVISLVLAVGCVVGGLWLVPFLAGSDQTPWPQAGIVLGWVAYRAGRAAMLSRLAPPPR